MADLYRTSHAAWLAGSMAGAHVCTSHAHVCPCVYNVAGWLAGSMAGAHVCTSHAHVCPCVYKPCTCVPMCVQAMHMCAHVCTSHAHVCPCVYKPWLAGSVAAWQCGCGIVEGRGVYDFNGKGSSNYLLVAG